MSERYGACRLCRGSAKYSVKTSIEELDEFGNPKFKFEIHECPSCLGTGFSGDANDYFDPSYRYRLED